MAHTAALATKVFHRPSPPARDSAAGHEFLAGLVARRHGLLQVVLFCRSGSGVLDTAQFVERKDFGRRGRSIAKQVSRL